MRPAGDGAFRNPRGAVAEEARVAEQVEVHHPLGRGQGERRDEVVLDLRPHPGPVGLLLHDDFTGKEIRWLEPDSLAEKEKAASRRPLFATLNC